MAIRLDDLSKHYDPDLYLPISGQIYCIAAPSIAEAERVYPLLWGPNAADFSPEDEHEEIEKILGAAFDQMATNEVPAPYVNHAGRTALIHFCSGPQGRELGRGHWTFAHLTDRIDVRKLMEHLAHEQAKAAAADG